MPPSKLPSRDYFDARFQEIARHFNASVGNVREDVSTLSKRMDDGFHAVDRRFDTIDKQFIEVNTKLDAIMEMVAVRQEVRNLVRELKDKGVDIDAEKIFLA